MKIRAARSEDYVGMARLRRQTIRFVNSRDYSEQIIRSWSAKGSTREFRESAVKCKRWVALDKGKIIGFCEHSFECELSRIYVHKNHLRQGVGSRLLKIAEVSLRGHGCSEITVESTTTAKSFYTANGYNIINKSIYKGRKRQPIYIMIKQLR
jgi:N-acetylglutamate synthase-like GNAT family acetyltransferase